jgi:hypothetical protein
VFARIRADLLRFQVFQTGGSELAIAAAQNYRELRQRGYAVHKTIDCLIATFCLQAKHQLLHRDRDFDCFEKVLGLRVLHAGRVISEDQLQKQGQKRRTGVSDPHDQNLRGGKPPLRLRFRGGEPPFPKDVLFGKWLGRGQTSSGLL